MKAISVKKAVQFSNLWSAVVNLVGVIAMVLALARDDRSSVVAVVIALVIIVVRQRKSVLHRARGVGALGRYFTGRYVVLACIAVNAAVASDSEFTAAWIIAIVLAALSIEAERLIRALNGVAAPYAFNLPDRPTRNSAAFPYGYLFTADVLALLLLGIAPVLSVPVLVAGLCVTVLAALFAVASLLDVLGRIRARRSFQDHTREVLESIGPVFYVYWDAPRKSAFQVNMWLPYLERIGVPFALVVRNAHNLRELSHITNRPVILRRSIRDLDELVVPSVRGVFYVNNAMKNNHMIRYSELTHIQLLHGESDKAASVNPVMRMFDLDFVAGQAAIDRFEKFGVDMPHDMFRIVGRPQVEDVEAATAPIGSIAQPTVLYAPTWKGYQEETDYCSLTSGPTIIQQLLDRGCTVIFRPHPYSYRDAELTAACNEIKDLLAADAAATGRPHRYGQVAEKDMSIVDCFNAADAMISDVSSVVGDFLHSQKPLAMVAKHAAPDEFVQQFPMAQAAYVIEEDLANLPAVLDDMLGDDPHGPARIECATYYLGDIPRDRYADYFVDVAREELHVTQSDMESRPALPQAARDNGDEPVTA